MADFGAIIAQAEIAKAQFAAAESRGYARGIEAAAKVCDDYAKAAGESLHTYEKYCAAMGCAVRIRALLPTTNPAPSEGVK